VNSVCCHQITKWLNSVFKVHSKLTPPVHPLPQWKLNKKCPTPLVNYPYWFPVFSSLGKIHVLPMFVQIVSLGCFTWKYVPGDPWKYALQMQPSEIGVQIMYSNDWYCSIVHKRVQRDCYDLQISFSYIWNSIDLKTDTCAV